MKSLIFILIFSISSLLTFQQFKSYPSDSEIQFYVDEVNKIRQSGCYCGNEYMQPVESLTWNKTLYTSAINHAMDMYYYNFFAHYSIQGEDIGTRLDKYGYDWKVAGENLGYGQSSFHEVLLEWLESYSHCIMLMNPKIKEMAVARYKNNWVQHFGAPMPRGHHRIGRK